MFNFKHVLARILLAASLAGAMAPGLAMPIYRVDIDTSSLGTGSAFLGLNFLGLSGAGEASATVTNLTGAFSGAATLSGSVTGGVPGPLLFTNINGGGDWFQAIELGDSFSFDVSFMAGSGSTGTTFGWALFDAVQYLGVEGDLGNVFLQPAAPADQRLLMTLQDAGLVRVTVIPEPSTLALMLLALLAIAAWLVRGARKRHRANRERQSCDLAGALHFEKAIVSAI